MGDATGAGWEAQRGGVAETTGVAVRQWGQQGGAAGKRRLGVVGRWAVAGVKGWGGGEANTDTEARGGTHLGLKGPRE